MKKPNFNNPRAIIVLAEQNSWATCGSLRQRLTSSAPAWIFFLQILSSRNLAGRETSKQQKYNNARAIIVPLDQDIWAICGSLRQRLKSGATAWIFCKSMLPWYEKKPKFNNARAIIVLRQQNIWVTCGTLLQRLQSCAPDMNFLANFAAVVRWAVREKAKVQQRRCHYLPVMR